MVTVFCCWLGWNIQRAKQREHMLALDGVGASDGFAPKKPMPIGLRLVGAQGVMEIALDDRLFTEADVLRFKRLFPESEVERMPFEGGVRIIDFSSDEAYMTIHH